MKCKAHRHVPGVRACAVLIAMHAFAVLVFASANVPWVLHWQPQPLSGKEILSGTSLPGEVPSGQAQSTAPQEKDKSEKSGKKDEKKSQLRPESQLAIVRFVDGEFARAVRPLPSVKQGFKIRVGSPVDSQALQRALTTNVAAASPGDTVQITQILFHPDEIRVDINGGSKKHKRLRDRVQVQVGAGPLPQGGVVQNQAPGIQLVGSTLLLEFGGPVPDITPDQLKKDLSEFLDFSRQRSAAVHWVDTLPPEFKKAVEEKRAMVGMDHEMVIAALGQPGRKVRERNQDGVETEDWIYGQPPEKVIFVTFIGDKVTKVQQFN